MSINIGSTSISDIKVGETQVDKVYVGDELVWQKVVPSINALKFHTSGTQTLSVDTTKLGSISPVFEYSLDNGSTWTTWNVRGGGLQFGNGTDLYVRGSNTFLAKAGTNYVNFVFDNAGGLVECTGNIMHLFDYTQNLTYFPDSGTSSRGIKYLFYNCTKLSTAPDLPAMILLSSCYFHTFDGCTNLTVPPTLPCINLFYACYQYMFANSGLTSIPALLGTQLEPNCYGNMFYNCSGVKMSLTQTGEYVYEYRFGVSPEGYAVSMFENTGGTFTGSPDRQTYYTANPIVS